MSPDEELTKELARAFARDLRQHLQHTYQAWLERNVRHMPSPGVLMVGAGRFTAHVIAASLATTELAPGMTPETFLDQWLATLREQILEQVPAMRAQVDELEQAARREGQR
jgi:hypothetical protein